MSDQSREEKTEELRDLFVEVTDESTVTEEQEESHGTLKNREEIDEQIADLVEEMVEKFDINTKIETDQLVELVRGYHDGLSDTEIAADLGDKSLNKTVKRTRVKLHLFRESDADAPFDLAEMREMIDENASTSEMADELDVSESTVRSYANYVDSQREADECDNTYQDEFEAILEDREISQKLTSTAKDDGLRDATEDMEVDVDM